MQSEKIYKINYYKNDELSQEGGMNFMKNRLASARRPAAQAANPQGQTNNNRSRFGFSTPNMPKMPNMPSMFKKTSPNQPQAQNNTRSRFNRLTGDYFTEGKKKERMDKGNENSIEKIIDNMKKDHKLFDLQVLLYCKFHHIHHHHHK